MSPQRVAALCYHRVYSDDDTSAPPVQPGTYCGHVRRSRFERQMHYLAKQSCSVITYVDLVAWLVNDQSLPERAVLIDFDDNRLGVIENAYPILRVYGWPATVFVISSLADGKSPWGPTDYPAMDWRQLECLVDAGWLIGAHTRTHPLLDELYAEPDGLEKVEAELAGGKADIEDRLGISVKHFAYPSGRSRPEVEEMVALHYESARLWNAGGPFVYNTKQTNRYRLEANNINELMDETAFHRLVDGILG